MNAAEALQEFLRPPQAVRNLKREEAILGQAEVSRIVIAPGIENEREEIAVYRWGDGDRRGLLGFGLGGKRAQYFSLVGGLRDPGVAVCAFFAATHREYSRGFSRCSAISRAGRRR